MKALRVLLVEDDSIIGVLLAELLEEMGYDVCAIEATEAGAVTTAVRCRPDLMIVDVRLGEGNGVSAVEKIFRTGPVPHVFISSERTHVFRPGAVFLQKPFREPELARAVQRAFGATAVS